MEQEKQEAPVQGKKKRLSTPLLIFIILMAVTAVLCAIVAGIWLHGRSSLRNGGSAPTVTPGGTEQLDSYTVLHDGKYYRYKEHMVNLLLIGVDSDNKPAAPLPYGSDNQADVILVAALDTDANKMTLISVSRDTMCDIGVPDDTGEISGVAHTQLALSFSNGDGLYESCRLCREAVSQLFYGLQFDGCAAFYMGGIGRLNDAVGGVTVNVLDDYPFTNVPGGWNMYPGQNVTLTGQQARLYIQCRRGDATGNEDRMQRQKQYMLALIGQVLAPLFAPLGFGDWRCATSLISGFIAKESVVSTLEVLLGGTAISGLFTTRSALSFLVFTLLYTPCVAAVATIRRELDSSLKTLGVVAMQCGVAWLASLAMYAIAGLF